MKGNGGGKGVCSSLFSNPSKWSWGAGFIEERPTERGGKNKFKFPPQKAASRIQDLGGNSWHSWNTLGERIMAGQVQKARGQKGQSKLLAGHPKKVASQACTTQICGQNPENVNQEREKPTF